MAIEVLLRRSVDSLGKVGEVVRVRPGYARNYLFPHGIAVAPTAANLKLVEKDKAAEAVLEAERAKVRAELATRIAAASVSIEAKANPEGHLFGSVGARQVAEVLTAKGFSIEEKMVHVEPVKQLGEYEAKIGLGGGTEVALKFWVVEEAGAAAGPATPPPAGPPSK